MKVLVFDLKGTVAHFRRPDTAVTQATYPFITRTALRGLLGAILGVEPVREGWTGIELRAPVRTRAQQMSMIGKGFFGNGKEFNRPTVVELLIRPAYRIYYAGPYREQLAEYVAASRSVYPTCLGTAYSLTVPRFVGEWNLEEWEPSQGEVIRCRSVVPVTAVRRLIPRPGAQYARAGGMLYEMVGERVFRGGVSVLYDANGEPLEMEAKPSTEAVPVKFVRLESGEVVALW